MVSSPFKATPHIALQRSGNGVLASDALNGGVTTFEHVGDKSGLLRGPCPVEKLDSKVGSKIKNTIFIFLKKTPTFESGYSG